MTPPSSTLRKAAELQERIEQLQQELDALFQQTNEAADDAARRPEGQKQPVTPPAARRGKATVS
jgi:prefoldin subunit 5